MTDAKAQAGDRGTSRPRTSAPPAGRQETTSSAPRRSTPTTPSWSGPGGERVRGKANIIAFRSTYPARQRFELHRITGCHNLWVNEYTIRYDDKPVMVVGIMEFRDEKVVRERIYFGDPWSRLPGGPSGSSGSTPTTLDLRVGKRLDDAPAE